MKYYSWEVSNRSRSLIVKFQSLLYFLCVNTRKKEEYGTRRFNHVGRAHSKFYAMQQHKHIRAQKTKNSRSVLWKLQSPRKICFPARMTLSHSIIISLHGVNTCFIINFEISNVTNLLLIPRINNTETWVKQKFLDL